MVSQQFGIAFLVCFFLGKSQFFCICLRKTTISGWLNKLDNVTVTSKFYPICRRIIILAENSGTAKFDG